MLLSRCNKNDFISAFKDEKDRAVNGSVNITIHVTVTRCVLTIHGLQMATSVDVATTRPADTVTCQPNPLARRPGGEVQFVDLVTVRRRRDLIQCATRQLVGVTVG